MIKNLHKIFFFMFPLIFTCIFLFGLCHISFYTKNKKSTITTSTLTIYSYLSFMSLFFSYTISLLPLSKSIKVLNVLVLSLYKAKNSIFLIYVLKSV